VIPVNAVADEQHDAPRPVTPGQLREIAQMLFAIGILEQRSHSENSPWLWRIRLKVARHMYGVLVRRAGMSDVHALPELSPAEQDELLRTHWILQLEAPRPSPAARNVEWVRELEAKVSRFADRMRSRRLRRWTDREP
jgi:hypothetical protein